jgi:hypothetical protein
MEHSLLQVLQTMDRDRRNKGRVVQKMVVQFPEHQQLHWAELLNLSQRGMFLKGPIGVTIGDSLPFMFFVKDLNAWIRGQAVVRWYRKQAKGTHFPEGAGVEFIEINKESQFVLNQYLQVTQAMRLIEKLENRQHS